MKRRKTLMKKIGIIAVLSMLVVALAAVPAMAAKTSPSGVHFITEPTCTSTQSTAPNGRTTATITCTGGSVAGLGSEPVSVYYTATGGCQTEGNDSYPPGHLQSTPQTVTPKGGRINLGTYTISVSCPPGLQTAVIDPSSLELVISNATSPFQVLKVFTVPEDFGANLVT